MISRKNYVPDGDLSMRLSAGLEELRQRKGKDKVRPEDIAHDMILSYNTIKNWMKRRRVPKIPMIRELERLYKVKILEE